MGGLISTLRGNFMAGERGNLYFTDWFGKDVPKLVLWWIVSVLSVRYRSFVLTWDGASFE